MTTLEVLVKVVICALYEKIVICVVYEKVVICVLYEGCHNFSVMMTQYCLRIIVFSSTLTGVLL